MIRIEILISRDFPRIKQSMARLYCEHQIRDPDPFFSQATIKRQESLLDEV